MAKEPITYKDHSRTDWTVTLKGTHFPGLERINTGCLQRMADAAERQARATEIMAADRIQMERDLKDANDEIYSLLGKLKVAERRIAALKGVITRLKKRNH
jgi:hypothetical protein